MYLKTKNRKGFLLENLLFFTVQPSLLHPGPPLAAQPHSSRTSPIGAPLLRALPPRRSARPACSARPSRQPAPLGLPTAHARMPLLLPHCPVGPARQHPFLSSPAASFLFSSPSMARHRWQAAGPPHPHGKHPISPTRPATLPYTQHPRPINPPTEQFPPSFLRSPLKAHHRRSAIRCSGAQTLTPT